MDIVVGKVYKSSEGKKIRIVRESDVFSGFPFCGIDTDNIPYRFSRSGVEYFDFGHTLIEEIE